MRLASVLLRMLLLAGGLFAQTQPPPPPAGPPAEAVAPAAPAAPTAPDANPFLTKLRSAIDLHLGKPYVWGATGLKSYDCSGFVWRVMTDAGLLVKRTTARKYYMCLPKIDDAAKWQFGTIVFFDDLKHCGIVADKTGFYHAQLSKGTNRSDYRPFWRPKVYGFRGMPAPAGP